jgi:hypothetical protein
MPADAELAMERILLRRWLGDVDGLEGSRCRDASASILLVIDWSGCPAVDREPNRVSGGRGVHLEDIEPK